MRTGLGVWEAGQHVSILSAITLTTDKLTPPRDTAELSAELKTLTVSVRKDIAP